MLIKLKLRVSINNYYSPQHVPSSTIDIFQVMSSGRVTKQRQPSQNVDAVIKVDSQAESEEALDPQETKSSSKSITKNSRICEARESHASRICRKRSRTEQRKTAPYQRHQEFHTCPGKNIHTVLTLGKTYRKEDSKTLQ